MRVCGYKFKGWRLTIGRWREGNVYYGKMPKSSGDLARLHPHRTAEQ